MSTRLLKWIAAKAPAYRALERSHGRDREIVRHYASGMRDVWDAAAGVKSPNGTTRKVKRIVQHTFDTLPA